MTRKIISAEQSFLAERTCLLINTKVVGVFMFTNVKFWWRDGVAVFVVSALLGVLVEWRLEKTSATAKYTRLLEWTLVKSLVTACMRGLLIGSIL